MKTEKNKNIFFRITQFVTIAILLLCNSCQNDFETIGKDENAIKIEHFALEKNTELKSFINNSFSGISQKNSNVAKFLDNSEINIDIETGLFAADAYNNINYSFRFYPTDAAENEIYNLIVNFLANGQKQTFVEKYVCDIDSFENFKANDYHFQYFKGTVSTYEATNFLTKTTTAGKNGDQPCPPVLITTIGNGGLPRSGNIPIQSGGSTYMPNISIPSHTSGGILGGSGVSFAYIVTPASSGTSSSGSGYSCCGGKGCKVKPGQQTQTGGTQKTGTTPCATPLPVGPVVAVTHPSTIQLLKSKLPNLTVEQFSWLRSNVDMQPTFYSFLSGKNFSEEAKSFVLELINESMLTGLKLDPEKSVESPFFIDLSSVSGNTPEELKFNQVYNMLTNSPKFRELFTNMFGTNPLFNVKFKIDNIPQGNGSGRINGICSLYSYTNNLAPFNLITIDRSHLLTANNVSIALSIMHECIHAYLNIKLRNPSIGMTIDNINNMDFVDCINTYYNSFSGNQTQHNFFVNNMIPTMVNIFLEIKDLLLTPTQINNVVNNPHGNSSIYAVTQTTPSVETSNVIPWNWNDYFTHVSFTGLQNCTAYNTHYPVGSPNTVLANRYLYVAAFNFFN